MCMVFALYSCAMEQRYLYILCLLFLPMAVVAQDDLWQNQRQRHLPAGKTQYVLDTLTLIPGSVIVLDSASRTQIDTALYRISQNGLSWSQAPSRAITVEYRVFPFDLGRSRQRIDTSEIREEDGLIALDYNPFEKDIPTIDFRGLQYNGSFARGISFGNSQDLVLNSRFNLQMAGVIGDDIELAAAITDENIPLQAEGNTQQLREFDKVFIRLRKDNNQLIAGDYELQRPEGYFMNYFKKLQGATVSNRLQLGDNGSLSNTGSVAVARGQFARNRLDQQEGNQGPYKLRGNQGERFIIVLAGTEKVWLDGEVLQRGLEQDYTINYDRGEITFTHRRLITKDSRIVVEFEYSDREYVRSLYAAGTTYESERAQVYVNIFSQQDSRNATGDTPLSDAEKQLLSLAGDNPDAALISTIDTLEQSAATRATYELRDTLVRCNGRDTLLTYLSYATDPERARYVARFSFVGPGNGDYEIDPEQLANERVYRWVAPDTVNCRSSGSYAPLRRLQAPQQQRMFSVGGSYQLKHGSVFAEVAYSQLDLNRFSRLDAGDDNGLAAYTRFEHRQPLGQDSSGWTLRSDLSYEYKAITFESLNPYRAPDFLRDWNLVNIQGQGQVQDADEQLGRAALSLEKEQLGRLTYAFSTFLRDSLYTGLRQQAEVYGRQRGWLLDSRIDMLRTDELTQETRLFRPHLELRKSFAGLGGWEVGWRGEREKSERFGMKTDTLAATSYFFDRYRFFLQSPETDQYQLGFEYRDRQDYAPVERSFQRASRAREGNVNGRWSGQSEQHRLDITGNLSYRQLSVQNESLSRADAAETFLGRFDINASLWQGVLRSNTTYEIGSGQEPRVEFTYAKVRPGSGTHIWLDSLYNNDGKIQFNEMEIAPFQDLADYVRISVITDDFIRTDNAGLNQSISLDPRRRWAAANGLRRWLSKLATISNIQVNRKTRATENVRSWDPLQWAIPDTALVSLTANIRNTLFFNRANPDFNLQFGQSDNRSRIVQTTGYESRRLSEYLIQGKLNLNTAMSGEITYRWGQKAADSEFFNNRDYTLQFREWEPALTYLPSRNFRLVVGYRYRFDRNTLPGGNEKAQQHSGNLEATYRPGSSSYGLRFSYVQVGFTGATNSPVGFAILNGLQRGRNLLWNFSLNRQLAKNIQLSLSYEGRQTGTANVIHVGRAQVAATF